MASLALARSRSADLWPRVVVIVFALLQIVTPTLPALGLGEPIGAQSDSVRTLVTPAGWAFAIWGPLYTGTILFAIWQALPAQHDNRLVAHLRWPAAGAFLGNALWAAYTQVFGVSALPVVIITSGLVGLLAIYRRFYDWPQPFSRGECWLAVLPLSALAARLTAATIVNIASTLRFHGVEAGDAAPSMAAAVVVVGGVIAAAALVAGKGNPPYALVFLWALGAIYAAGGQEAGIVAGAVAVAAILVIGTPAVGLWRGGLKRWFG